MKKVVAFILTLTLGLSLMACGKQAATTGESKAPDASKGVTQAPDEKLDVKSTEVLKGLKIGNSICYKGDEWCSDLSDKMEFWADKYGIDTVVQDGDLNDETQSKQIENMIAEGVDAIFIDPVSPQGCGEALKKAIDAGIPIFSYDGYLEGTEAVTTITWDQPATGILMGEYVSNYVKENLNGKARVVLLSLAASPACVERGVAFKETVAKLCPGIEIFNTQDCEGNREKAANAITNIVEPFDLVVSVVDNGAWGAISALEARGLNKVKVFSMGAFGAEPFDALKENHPNYQACIVVPPSVIAKELYEAAAQHFNGEKVEKITNITIAVADSKNVDEFWDFK